MRIDWRPLFLLSLVLALPAAADGSTVVSSKHDLSVTGGGSIRAATETQVCVFCHVGHSRKPLGDNRPDVRADYVPYQSSTMRSQMPSSPTGASRVCLSCHDGTIAMGETVASGTIQLLSTAPGGRLAPDAPSNLGTDLRRTHPVSFSPVPDRRHHAPEGQAPARLDARGQVQCTSCHDPHSEKNDPVRGKFLLASNRYSVTCLACHSVDFWASAPSSHQVSQAIIPPGAAAGLPYPTVAENACEACHRPHAASVNGRLVRSTAAQPEQAVCVECHNGRVAKTDLSRELAKPFAHSMASDAPAVHDQAERPGDALRALPETRVSAPRHVTCVDCHNPHAANAQPAVEGRVGGALAGVWGIDLRGERVEQVMFEYEVCFKCHGDSANQPRGIGQARNRPRRALPTQNLRLSLSPESSSAHPVLRPGRGNSPSLKDPASRSQLLACSACHGSESSRAVGGSGPVGPHGSSNEFLLSRNLSTADFTVESPEAYALCYQCHEREQVLSERSQFPMHRKHVVDTSTPCTACHNSHGVAAVVGLPDEGAHLMDFDVNIVEPTPRGVRQYQSRGPRSGTCSTSCHGVVHEDTGY